MARIPNRHDLVLQSKPLKIRDTLCNLSTKDLERLNFFFEIYFVVDFF